MSRNLTAVVGDLPVIERLDAPADASAGRTFTVSWKTLNATQVSITVGGLPIFQTLPGDQARVTEGSLALPDAGRADRVHPGRLERPAAPRPGASSPCAPWRCR